MKKVEYSAPPSFGWSQLNIGAANAHLALQKLDKRFFNDGRLDFDFFCKSIVNYSKGQKLPTKNGVVYLAKGDKFFKIGKTSKIESRSAQIKLQMPFPVEIIHKIRCENMRTTEKFWHLKFAASRVNGERFELTPTQIREFCSKEKM